MPKPAKKSSAQGGAKTTAPKPNKSPIKAAAKAVKKSTGKPAAKAPEKATSKVTRKTASTTHRPGAAKEAGKKVAGKKAALPAAAQAPGSAQDAEGPLPTLSTMPAASQLEYFSQLLTEIYDAALDPTRWESCLNTIARALFANNASLIVRHGTSDGLGTIVTGAGKSHRAQSASPFYTSSPFIGLPLNQIVTIGDFLSDADWRQSAFYLQWCKPHHVYHMMGVDFMTEGRGIYGLRFTRPESHAPFSLSDKRLCQMLLPHLQRALALTQGINQGKQIGQLYSQAMTQLMVGTIILDHKGDVLQANASAQRVLDAGDGLRVVNKQLMATWNADNKKLQRLISDVLTLPHDKPGVIEAVSVTRASGKSPWGLVVRAVPPGAWIDGKGVPAVAVFVRDPDGNSQPPARLAQQLFALTPAETALATQLANGLSLEESAVALGIRHNTARAHLRSIFSKTGARRQTELVRMFLNSVMPLGVTPESSGDEPLIA